MSIFDAFRGIELGRFLAFVSPSFFDFFVTLDVSVFFGCRFRAFVLYSTGVDFFDAEAEVAASFPRRLGGSGFCGFRGFSTSFGLISICTTTGFEAFFGRVSEFDLFEKLFGRLVSTLLRIFR